MMRRSAALLSLALVLLTACGDDGNDGTEPSSQAVEDTAPDLEPIDPAGDDPVLDAVTVAGDIGSKPAVEVTEPVTVEQTARRVLVEGDGEPFADGDDVVLQYVQVDGNSGEEMDDSYGSLPQTFTFDQHMLAPYMAAGLVEVPVGSRVLVAAPGDEGPDSEAGDTLLFVVDVVDPAELPQRAEGTPVDPVPGLPAVTLDDDGAPSVEIPEGDPPAELTSQALIRGDGPEVADGQMVLAHYTGVLWDDGSQFDTSWEGDDLQPAGPQPFDLQQVIRGWGEGLAGHTVGSQVLLVVPPDLGYGSEGAGEDIPPGSTLVFVVDILTAADT